MQLILFKLYDFSLFKLLFMILLWRFYLFLKILFISRKGETHQSTRGTSTGCPLHTPNRGPGPQPRHVPWLGIKPVTFWIAGQHSVHWATPTRAENFILQNYMWCMREIFTYLFFCVFLVIRFGWIQWDFKYRFVFSGWVNLLHTCSEGDISLMLKSILHNVFKLPRSHSVDLILYCAIYGDVIYDKSSLFQNHWGEIR